MRFTPLVTVLAALLPACHSLSSTDFPQDGDVPQSGYSDNHNFDPSTLSQYTLNWTATFNTNEYFYAKPLIYTPSGTKSERIYVVSNQNIVRILDGMTGAVLVSRTLDPAYAASDTSCGDILNNVGIIGTPIIDTATDLMYFWAKSYVGGAAGPQGVPDGVYNGDWKLYAVKVSDLSNAPGFPVSIRGLNAYNDRTRYLIAGTLNQRPGLAMIGNVIVTGFGSHCDNFNFTGYLVTASKTPGVGITDIQAMVAAPGAPSPQATDIMSQKNGKSGIWQAGFGLAVDAITNRVFFAVGNGQGKGQLNGDDGVPTSGKTYLSTLENSVASYSVDPNSGKLTQLDWFCPTLYDHMNGGDQDVGSSGVALLDPAVFSGGGVNRIAIAAGKNGTVSIMDADNLGGFMNGPGQSDGILQGIVFPQGESFFGGVASYPLEGGYIYFVPTSNSIFAYKFGLVNGKPWFTFAGQSAETGFAGRGSPRVTSLNGKPGTGIVWLSDVNLGVVAYNAIPVDGVLQPYTFPATGRLNKFQRPSFGNARVYTSENNKILAMGGPVAPPNTIITSTGTPTPTPTTSKSSTSTSSSKSSTTSSSSTSISSTTTSSSSTTKSSTSTSTSSTSTSKSSTSTSSLSTKSSSSSSTSTSTSKSSTSSSTSVSSISTSMSTTSTVKPTSTTVTSSSTTSTPAAYVTPSPPSGKRTTFNWNVTWVNAAPDGYTRPMIGVNGVWPPPAIVLNYGDTMVLNVYNGLGNESISLHFHGIFQLNTTFEDGPSFATQCPIPPGNSFVYQFNALQVGTYWWHGHHGGEYIDGLRGAFIIKNPSPPYGTVNQDIILTLSDHYHEEAPNLIHYYQSVENTNAGGTEPVPDSNLINDAQNVKITLVAGQTNLFRIINMGAVAGQYLQFDQHTMTIVEVDGQYVQPYDVQQLFVAVAQRYAVIVKSKSDSKQNFAIVATMNAKMFYDSALPANPTVSGWLVYSTSNPFPAPFTLTPLPFSDTVLVPLDQQPLLDPPSQTVYIAADFNADENGITRGYLNGVTYVNQKVPTLYSVLSAPAAYQNDIRIYGTGSNPYILPLGAIIEIEITNHDSRAHPFHLHGHAFQVIYRYSPDSLFPGLDDTPALPMKRDVITVFANSAATIRFVADNPGIQLFHCHTEWHVVNGMMLTFIEAPTELVARKPYVPVSHRAVCDDYGISRKGNAAGNSNNWLDLTGANTVAPTSNWGALTNPPS